MKNNFSNVQSLALPDSTPLTNNYKTIKYPAKGSNEIAGVSRRTGNEFLGVLGDTLSHDENEE